MSATLQREHWDGHPVDCGDAWSLRKGGKVVRCSLVTHQFGWGAPADHHGPVRSQVCRSADEILSTHEEWKSAMVEKGWRPL